MNAEKRMEELRRDEQVRAELKAKERKEAAEQERIRHQATERAWRRRLAREQKAGQAEQGHGQRRGPGSSSENLKGGDSSMDSSTTGLDREMLDRLRSYGILLKKDVTQHRALGLIAEELMRRLGQIWQELFPDSQRKDVALSDQETGDLVHDG